MTTEPLDAPDAAQAEDERTAAEQLEDFALRDDYQLNPRFVEMVVDAVEAEDDPGLVRLTTRFGPPTSCRSYRLRAGGAPRRPGPGDLAGGLSPRFCRSSTTRIREEMLTPFTPARLPRPSPLDSDARPPLSRILDEDRGATPCSAAMPAFERAPRSRPAWPIRRTPPAG
jgi:hypothetical protein